jgi:hypothetical protein
LKAMKEKRPNGIVQRVATGLAERLASTWILLSDTGTYLSKTSLFAHYEEDLRSLRRGLAAAAKDPEKERKIRASIVELRRSLRLQGHDLSMGRYELALGGFRSDDAVAEGFRRLVLFVGRSGIMGLAGQDNHIALLSRLEAQARSAGWIEPGQPHFLWFRWNGRILELCGADSESKDDFVDFRTYCSQADAKLRIIATLRKWR